jgi:hypothetical protein
VLLQFGNNIGGDGLVAVAEALLENNTLQWLAIVRVCWR